METKTTENEMEMVNDVATQLNDIIKRNADDVNWDHELLVKKMKLLATGLKTGEIDIDDILDIVNNKEMK